MIQSDKKKQLKEEVRTDRIHSQLYWVNIMATVTVNIKGKNSEGKDWLVPRDVNFRMVLVSTCKLNYGFVK